MTRKLLGALAILVWVAALGCESEARSGGSTGFANGGPVAFGGTGAPPLQGPGFGVAGTSVVTGGAGGSSGASGGSGNGGATGSSGATAAGAGGMLAAGTGGAGAGGAGSGDAGAGGAGGPEPMRIAIEMKNVAIQEEDHACVTLELPNQQPVWIKSIHATLTPGSHHLIVDRETADASVQNTPASCFPTMGGDSSRLIIAQQPETQVDLPAGTAFRLQARQKVFLQLHYFNYTSAVHDISGSVVLELADETAGTPTEVQSLFTGQMALYLPAGQATTAEFFLDPASDGPVNVFALTSHTHSLGVHSTIERVQNEGAPDTTPIHESTDWSEPPLTMFAPPLAFNGNDGLRLRCNYMNDTDQDVTFGTRFEDEMCFMWLYFYPQ